jgi:hypothetical protein
MWPPPAFAPIRLAAGVIPSRFTFGWFLLDDLYFPRSPARPSRLRLLDSVVVQRRGVVMLLLQPVLVVASRAMVWWYRLGRPLLFV